jgi:hypothetical protein
MHNLDERVISIGYLSYNDYLKSDHWRITRSKYKKKSCFCCMSKNRLQIHHLHYDRLGCERDVDIITVCRKCHKKIHSIHPFGNAHNVVKQQYDKQREPKIKKKYYNHRRNPKYQEQLRRFNKKIEKRESRDILDM